MAHSFYRNIEQTLSRIWSLVPNDNFANDALMVAADAIGADKAVIVNAFLSGNRGGCLASPHLNDEQISHYNVHYAPINPINPPARELLFREGIAQDVEGVIWRDLKRTEYFDGWVRPYWRKEIATLVESDGNEMVVASFARDVRRPHFDDASRQALKQIVHELSKARWANQHLRPAESVNGGKWQPASQRFATISLDRRLRIVERDGLADDLLARLRILTVKNKTLAARDAELEAALTAAATERRTFTCLDRAGLNKIDVIPCRKLPEGATTAETCVLLVLTMPNGRGTGIRTSPQIAGLTQTEAQIVTALAEGLSLNEIAYQRHRSVHTVRTQLKAIYRKLDIHSRVQLINLLNGASPP